MHYTPHPSHSTHTTTTLHSTFSPLFFVVHRRVRHGSALHAVLHGGVRPRGLLQRPEPRRDAGGLRPRRGYRPGLLAGAEQLGHHLGGEWVHSNQEVMAVGKLYVFGCTRLHFLQCVLYFDFIYPRPILIYLFPLSSFLALLLGVRSAVRTVSAGC